MVTVGLDYGHGSNTFPPNKGVRKNGKGYAEHDFNSKLGLEIKRLLEHNGIDVVEGQGAFKPDVALRARTNLYNRKNVDIVFSIHANAGDPSVDGRCVFYWHTSSNGKKLAQYVVDEIKSAGYSTHGNGLHASKRGSWTNLHITRETKMPAVLVEHGFMTNNKDFELIFGSKQDQYIHDMARADAKAICRYFGKDFKDLDGKVSKPKKKSVSSSTAKKKTSSKSSSGSKWRKRTGNWTGQTLRKWDYGEPVRQMQEMLSNNNPPFYPDKGAKNNGIDGYYGDKTVNQVRRFQGYYGLTVDGLAGKQTYNKAKGNPSGSSSSGQSISQMASKIINDPNAPTGHDARRRWLGVDNSTYQKVRAEVNRRL